MIELSRDEESDMELPEEDSVSLDDVNDDGGYRRRDVGNEELYVDDDDGNRLSPLPVHPRSTTSSSSSSPGVTSPQLTQRLSTKASAFSIDALMGGVGNASVGGAVNALAGGAGNVPTDGAGSNVEYSNVNGFDRPSRVVDGVKPETWMMTSSSTVDDEEPTTNPVNREINRYTLGRFYVSDLSILIYANTSIGIQLPVGCV